MKRVAIIGGGLSGLISGILLAKKGVPCVLFEKRNYPQHRVCGEYVSNEALPFLKNEGLFPEKFFPSTINHFVLSSVRGQKATQPLDLGGFGISRNKFDHFLFEKAKEFGVEVHVETEVTDVSFRNNVFLLQTEKFDAEADVVVGSFGKRTKLDTKFGRKFTFKRSPYVGIKYHAKTSHPDGVIALHNFNGGYCGVVNIEGGTTNICYLASRRLLNIHKSIDRMEKQVLYQNPLLRAIFEEGEFVTDKPVVINEISFATKEPIYNHMLMTGDAAGMITPLCGNGMAIAIHTGKIAAETILPFLSEKISRNEMEQQYALEWKKQFAHRLRLGRVIQKLFGDATLSRVAVSLIQSSAPLAQFIIRNTHGEVF